MNQKISALKQNQQILGSKIIMLQDSNRRTDEEADRIRELIEECRENLNRIKSDALNTSHKSDCGNPGTQRASERCKSGPPGKKSCDPCDKFRKQEDPCDKFRKQEDPCAKFRKQEDPCDKSRKQEDPCAKFRKKEDPCDKFRKQEDPCDKFRKQDDPCAKFRKQEDPCGQSHSPSKSDPPKYQSKTTPCESQPDPCPCTAPSKSTTSKCGSPSKSMNSKDQDCCSDTREKSRQCLDKLGQNLEREVRVKISSGDGGCSQNTGGPLFDTNDCDCDGDDSAYQERVSCRVDLNQMKVNIKGSPEDLKKLDAVQLINLLDKFQCQELVLNTGSDYQQEYKEVPIFYFTHLGNLAMIIGIVMVGFLINANLCNPKRGFKIRFLLNMLYLGSFSFHYGIVLWMSFIRGLTLSTGLSPDLFNIVDNLILPKYFSVCVFLSAITLYSFLATHCAAPCTSWPLSVLVQVIIQAAIFFIELIAICYIVPAVIKLREATDELPDDDECPPPESYCKNLEKLAKLSWTISFINTITVVFMGSNLYYISSKLHIG